MIEMRKCYLKRYDMNIFSRIFSIDIYKIVQYVRDNEENRSSSLPFLLLINSPLYGVNHREGYLLYIFEDAGVHCIVYIRIISYVTVVCYDNDSCV